MEGKKRHDRNHFHQRFTYIFLIALVALSTAGGESIAAIRQVNHDSANCSSTGPLVYCDIQQAIDAAGSGDVIYIAPATYVESLKVSSATNRALTLVGSGISHTILASTTRGFITNEDLNIEHLTIEGIGPPKSGLGGGIYINGNATVNLSDVVIKGNHGGTGGGIAVLSGNVNLMRVAVVENEANIDATSTSSPNSAGGGIYVANGAQLLAVNSAILGNLSNIGLDPVGGFAAGIYNLGVTTLVNTTVSGNVAAATTTGGGGITNGNSTFAATLNLYNTTITANSTASAGGGVYNANGTVNVRSSIIAGNSDDGTAPNCGIDPLNSGSFASAGSNIIGTATNCSIATSSDLVDVSATQLDLLPLPADSTLFNDIPVYLVQGLNTNSVAINAVSANNCLDQNNNQLTDDQRGVARPATGCDSGAYEVAQDVVLYPANQITFEIQGTSTFYVALGQPPAQTVQLNISSDDPSEGTIASPTLSFNSSDWNTPKPVQINVQNDGIADGDQTYAVNVTATGINVPPKSISITNIDTVIPPGLIVSPANITIQEGGAADTFSVRLATPPASGSTVTISVSAVRDAGLDRQEDITPATLQFTDANWDIEQTVFVSAVDDNIVEGTFNYEIAVAVTGSNDPSYTTAIESRVVVQHLDNDQSSGTADVIFSGQNNLRTTENGTRVTFNAKLNSQPSADVVIDFVSNDPNEGLLLVGQSQLQTASLTFTPQNWNLDQPVAVVGVDDAYADGGKIFTILTTISSSDAEYSAINPADITIINDDNDIPGVMLTPTSGLVTSESGTSATFQVQLTVPPAPGSQVAMAAEVQPPAPGLPLEGSISLPAGQLIFDTSNYNQPQTVTVTGLDDGVVDCSKIYNIAISIDTAGTTSAPYASSVLSQTVSVTNTDNDASTSAQIVISKLQLTTSENGTTDSFNVCLTTQPTAPVNINMTIPAAGQGEGVFSGSLYSQDIAFNQTNWAEVRTVTIMGLNDAVVDGDQSYQIQIANAVSADPNYANMAIPNVTVTNQDNDSGGGTLNPGLVVSKTLLDTSESGAQDTVTIKLSKQPSNFVTVKVTVMDQSEGRIADSFDKELYLKRLTFGEGNWNTEQTITIIGLDDADDDGNIIYDLQLQTSESSAVEYQSIPLPQIRVDNKDNDRAKPSDPSGGGGINFELLLLLLIFIVARQRRRIAGIFSVE